MNTTGRTTPLRLLILALGGQGGGVLMNWIVAAARQAGHTVQATSVPGVAQRTGSTSYYIEIVRQRGSSQPRPPLSLVPMRGRVDVVLASELLEAARAMERGFVSPQLTTLIASTSRVYTTDEKIGMGDGRYDSGRVVEAARALAKRSLLLDLDTLARRHGTFVSATLFGALAGSGVLPWSVEVSRAVLGEGEAAGTSKAGFDAACEEVRQPSTLAAESGTGTVAPEADEAVLPPGRLTGTASGEVRRFAALGYARCCDYLDSAYGDLYLQRIERLTRIVEKETPQAERTLVEAARRLALWMSYEDIARVADLKSRRERFEKIREESGCRPGQLLRVTDHLKPRAEEIADILPVNWGIRLRNRSKNGGWVPLVGREVHLRTTTARGFWFLRLLSQARRLRRRSLRYRVVQEAIESWLSSLEATLANAPEFAAALAALPRLLKGYSDTLQRGERAYRQIWEQIVAPALESGRPDDHAPRLNRALEAALSDPGPALLDRTLERERVPANR
ncbi:MAG: indolepyruvate oxidoreductase subunit beta family protein [Gammaproteobacteria bacterium]